MSVLNLLAIAPAIIPPISPAAPIKACDRPFNTELKLSTTRIMNGVPVVIKGCISKTNAAFRRIALNTYICFDVRKYKLSPKSLFIVCNGLLIGGNAICGIFMNASRIAAEKKQMAHPKKIIRTSCKYAFPTAL